jgi:glycosyltransferase involved in cell wall biosynthesis
MIGTSTETQGGIASVVNAYRAGGLFDRIPVSYLSTHSDGSFLRKAYLALLAFVQYFGWLVFKPGFVLHAHVSSRASFWRKSFFIMPTLWAGNDVIFHLHGSEFMRFYLDECSAFRQKLVRHVMNRCTRIIVLSESWRLNIARITNNAQVTVLMNPAVPPGERRAVRPRRNDTLLFLGRLGHRKGIFVLLEALAAVRSQFRHVVLLCGGDGELDRVRAEMARLDLNDNVTLLGWVKGAAKEELLESSTVYVLPSFDEGVPMSILEAMAWGLPVIATPVGGIPEVVTDGREGMLVAPGDAGALGRAICRLLADAELRAQMSRNGRLRFQTDFSIQSVLDKLESIYRRHGVLPRAEIAASPP